MSISEPKTQPSVALDAASSLQGYPLSPTVPLSAIERLPIELLEDILIKSANCDLAILSTKLVSALSRPALKRQVAFSMLISDDPAIQSDLLRRRFVDLELFSSLIIELRRPKTAALYNKHSNHPAAQSNYVLGREFKLRAGCELPTRLFFPLENDPMVPVGLRQITRKIAFIIRLLKEGVSLRETRATVWTETEGFRRGKSFEAGQKGLHMAVESEDLEAVRVLTGIDRHFHARNPKLVISPTIETLKLAIIERNCDSVDVVQALLTAWNYTPQETADKEISKWCESRRQIDLTACKLERSHPDHNKEFILKEWIDRAWKPCTGYGSNSSSVSYHTIRNQLLGGNRRSNHDYGLAANVPNN
ncbi:MAG: hypothetical protein M1829_006646 [Trizodia sp. TS-e1964]|nr:MAG: hypothetical protein M1829_006646 [Trizodia sp. TS-e1964]